MIKTNIEKSIVKDDLLSSLGKRTQKTADLNSTLLFRVGRSEMPSLVSSKRSIGVLQLEKKKAAQDIRTL